MRSPAPKPALRRQRTRNNVVHDPNLPKLPVVVAGSIDSDERIDEARASGAWGFTVGGAVFERCFVTDGSYAEQVRHILARAAST